MSARNYQTMDPDLVLKILDGAESGMEEINRSNQKAQNAIQDKTCPHCNGGLLPRLPKDVDKIFGEDGGLHYVGWCPPCQKVIEE